MSFQYLCECQFDENVKFKTAINEEDPDKMRILPIGRDKDGQMYWFQLDQDDNVRVYVEEQDDMDGSSWKCIVKLVDKMKKVENSNIAPGFFNSLFFPIPEPETTWLKWSLCSRRKLIRRC